MGNIWLQTSDGKLIHLPVVGDDINSPDDVIKISASIVPTQDRCLDQDVIIEHPEYGTITIKFAPDNRTGLCNQCGECCTHLEGACPDPEHCGYIFHAKSGRYICPHLTVLPKGIGKPGGTECAIRATILDTLKGCTLFPGDASEIANCPNCSFNFN